MNKNKLFDIVLSANEHSRLFNLKKINYIRASSLNHHTDFEINDHNIALDIHHLDEFQ